MHASLSTKPSLKKNWKERRHLHLVFIALRLTLELKDVLKS